MLRHNMERTIYDEAHLYMAHVMAGIANPPRISGESVKLMQAGYLLPKFEALKKLKLTKPVNSIEEALEIIKTL